MNKRPLHIIMRQLVDTYGNDIVCDHRLRGLLADELGESFYEYRSSIVLAEQLGVGSSMLGFSSNRSDLNLCIRKQKQSFAENSKLDRVMSDYVIDSYAYALGLVKNVVVPTLEGTLVGLTQQITTLQRERDSTQQRARETAMYSQVALVKARRVRLWGLLFTLIGAALLISVAYFVLYDNGYIPKDPKRKLEKLFSACAVGDAKYVSDLLNNGVFVNSKDSVGDSPLHYAVRIGSAELIDSLLHHGADERLTDNMGRTPLELALESGCSYYAKSFVQARPHEWIQENYEHLKNYAKTQQSLLVLHDAYTKMEQIQNAIKAGSIAALDAKLAYRNGADLHYSDENGRTLLHYAAVNGNVPVLRHLIARGLDVNATDNAGVLPEKLTKNAANKNFLNHYRLKDQLIFDAVKKGNIALLKEVVEYGASVNDKDENGVPLIHYAVYRNFTMFTELQKLGADIKAKNRAGETAFFVAVKKNDLVTAQKLISLGLSVHDKNTSAQTPMTFIHNKTSKYLFDYTYRDSLFVAAVKHRNLDLAKTYLQLGANINYVSKYTGCAAIHYAVENNDVSSLKFLKSKGANMMLPYKNMAPVEKALMGQKKESLQFLLANDVGSANRVYANGKTLMHRALSMQNGAMWMNVLLSHGAKVDAMDNAGETPLAYAIQRNRTDLVAFLIKKNANVNRVDAYGNRPLHIAARYANGRIVKMLVDAGADPSVENNEGDKPVNVAENVGNESAQDELDNYSFFGKARKSLKSVKNAGAKLWDKVKELAS